MEKSLLVQLLSTLTNVEIRKWKQFVNSDFHCQNKYVRQLAIVVSTAIIKKRPLPKRELWLKLFPDMPYKESKLNNYTSDLLDVSYAFLEELSFRNKDGLRKDFLQQQLIERGLVQQAGRVGRRWKKNLDNSSFQNPEMLHEQFRYHYLQDQLALRKSNRVFGSHLLQKNLDFNRYYLLQQLIHHAEFLNRSNIVKGSYQLAHLDELMRRYQDNEQGVQSVPPIQIYVCILNMLLGKDPQGNFNKISQLINEFDYCFDDKENQVIYSYLFNFCVKQINSGKTNYYVKMFSLYKVLIDKNLLLQDGMLSQWTYTNVITVAIRLQEFSWTEEFLHTHLDFLPKSVQQNAYHYNLATIHFERQEYLKALIPLNELDFKDAFYQMAAKSIQLKIYYLLEEYEAFEALEAASRQFIIRNKQLSDYQQRSNVNFIRLIKKMNTYRQSYRSWSVKKRELIRDQFHETLTDSTHQLAHKDWLQNQLEILPKG